MTPEELQSVEQELNLLLPDYYKEFMLDYPLDLLTEYEEYDFFSTPDKLIDENKKSYLDFWGKPLNKKYFIIGFNGLGNYYMIDLEKDRGVIGFYHNNQTFYEIAISLEEYQNKLMDATHEENWGNDTYKVADLRD